MTAVDADRRRTAPDLPFVRCVFVNCPLDSDFLPILHAILFAIHDCGFIARIAVEDVGSSETRPDKITRIIRESRNSIHDISRVQITPTSLLPRFIMAFECGLALGAIRFGSIPNRDFLLTTGEPTSARWIEADALIRASRSRR